MVTSVPAATSTAVLMLPSPPAMRNRSTPFLTVSLMRSRSCAGGTSMISKRPACSRASRALSAVPDSGLTNAGMREAFVMRRRNSVVRLPEPRKGGSVWGLAQLLEGALPDLADALAGHAHQCADLLE